MFKKIFLIFVVLLLVGFLFIGYSYNKDYFLHYPRVKIALVGRKNLSENVLSDGEIAIEEESICKIKSEIGGKVKRIFVKEQDKVKKGQILAQIDETEKKWQFQQAKIELLTLEKQLEEAKTSGIPRDIKILQEKLDACKMKVQIYTEELKKMTLRTPIKGTVIHNYVEDGDIVTPGRVLLTIANLENLEVIIYVDVLDAYKVKTAQRITVTIPSFPEKKFMGSVISIEPVAEIISGKKVVKVTAKIDFPGSSLIPGTPVTAYITTKEANLALVVPVEAIYEEPIFEKGNPAFFLNTYTQKVKRYVFVLTEEKETLPQEEWIKIVKQNIYRVRKKEVEVGVSSVNEVEIKSGLNQFDQVVVYADRPLKDNDKVIVIPFSEE